MIYQVGDPIGLVCYYARHQGVAARSAVDHREDEPRRVREYVLAAVAVVVATLDRAGTVVWCGSTRS